MAVGNNKISKRLVLSYIIDWIILIIIAAVGGALSLITPNKRPFNVTDPDISFPYVLKEKISSGVLVVIGLVIPAAITFVVCIFIGTGPATEKQSSRSKALKRKLWEWNASWLGLALSLAFAFFLTNASKNLFGKPRPDLLARCNPNLANATSDALGGVGPQFDEGINLVSWTICRNPGSTLDDGFRSYPSGHSSFSFAGMTYLALFLCAKLAITIPFLNHQNLGGMTQSAIPPRRQAAAPPTYLLVFPLTAICIAIYVSSTRYSDFRHHGFDIISGALIGIVSAWLGFCLYHMPISRGGGWAWAPRAPSHAFGRGIGVVTYTQEDLNRNHTDLEYGRRYPPGQAATEPGHAGQHKASDGSEGIPLEDMHDGGINRGSDSSRRPLR